MNEDKIRELLSSFFNEPCANGAQALLRKLPSYGIEIPLPDEVSCYLSSFPEICKVVHEACMKTSDRFRAKSQLSLELYPDPEVKDEYLTPMVRQARYDENIMNNIDEISDEICVRLSDSNGWFIITTDFQPPKEKNNDPKD